MDSKTLKVSWDNSMTFVLSMVVVVVLALFLAVLMFEMEDKKWNKVVTMSVDSTKVDRHYLSQLHYSMMNESHETKVDRRMLMVATKTMKDD